MTRTGLWMTADHRSVVCGCDIPRRRQGGQRIHRAEDPGHGLSGQETGKAAAHERDKCRAGDALSLSRRGKLLRPELHGGGGATPHALLRRMWRACRGSVACTAAWAGGTGVVIGVLHRHHHPGECLSLIAASVRQYRLW
jgi:hypothetical protein